MDVLTFITELVKALAWPASIILLIFLLRHSLERLVPRIMKLRYKEFEADFGEALKRIETDVEKAKLPSAGEAEELEVGVPEQAGKKYRRLAEISPRVAILEAWRDVELAVGKLSTVDDYWDIQEDEQPDLFLTIERLNRKGKLDTASTSLYSELAKLRNRTLHAYDTQVKRDDAYEFAILASRLISKLRDLSS